MDLMVRQTVSGPTNVLCGGANCLGESRMWDSAQRTGRVEILAEPPNCHDAARHLVTRCVITSFRTLVEKRIREAGTVVRPMLILLFRMCENTFANGGGELAPKGPNSKTCSHPVLTPSENTFVRWVKELGPF